VHYQSSIPFEGNAAKAFDLAVSALTSLGFRTLARSDAMLELEGPGMNSTRQSSLLGASRIQVTCHSRQLALDAELGGVQRMTRFLMYFPAGLNLLLCLVFFAVFSIVFDHRLWVRPVLAVTGGNLLLWLFLAPVIARKVQARTRQGIDTLLNNMAVAGTS
jgi:hypothetical protein